MSDPDPYTYPETDVLRNKAGIRDAATLRHYEYRMSLLRSLELQESPIQGKFDARHLQAIHYYLFQDVYAWAGEHRTVDISKGSSHFARAAMIDSYGKSIVYNDIAADKYLAGMDKKRFVERLAHHYAELNALHPFRDGNGRSTRLFTEQLANHAGYDIDYSKVDPVQWNSAARDSFNGNLQGLKGIFSGIVRPEKTIAFEFDSPAEAIKKYPDLRHAYDGLEAAELVARHKFNNTEERQRYVGALKETLTQYVEQNNLVPAVPKTLREHLIGPDNLSAKSIER